MSEIQQDKKEHLIGIAEKLFAEHGFEGTSIRMLAKEAEVNIAMISYYFGSKEKMMEAILEKKANQNRENFTKISQMPHATSWEKIEAVIDLYVEMMNKNRNFHKIMFREVALVQREEVKDKIAEFVSNNMKNIKKIIQEGVENGVFRQVDTPMLMATLVGTISQTLNYSKLSEQMVSLYDNQAVNEKDIIGRLKCHLKEIFRLILMK
jgi:AcrR family transcriptional regulator